MKKFVHHTVLHPYWSTTTYAHGEAIQICGHCGQTLEDGNHFAWTGPHKVSV